jgi:hypothetical protein
MVEPIREHQTLSWPSMVEPSRPTKHMANSEPNLYRVGISQLRKTICGEPTYQTHPKLQTRTEI